MAEPARRRGRRPGITPLCSWAWSLTEKEAVRLDRLSQRDTAKLPVTHALQACDMLRVRAARVDRISGGESRHAILARALVTEPNLFLLDEPTTDLDPLAAHGIIGISRRNADGGRCVVAVLHARDLAKRYANHIAIPQNIQVTAGPPAGEALPAAAATLGLLFGLDRIPRLLPPVP